MRQLTEAGVPAGGRCKRDGFRIDEHEAVRSAVQLPGIPLHELRISELDHVERPDDLPVHADADGFHVLSGAQRLVVPDRVGRWWRGEGGAALAGCVSASRQLPIPSCAPLPAPRLHTSLLSRSLAGCSALSARPRLPTPRCARRAGQRVLVTRRETLLACSLILPMRAASGGGFSSVLAARGRERREDTQHAHIDILRTISDHATHNSGVRYSCGCRVLRRERGGR